ncbi:MAG: sulfatase activating formylglycine-generating enzyme, partial [Myxococcota bacterium]
CVTAGNDEGRAFVGDHGDGQTDQAELPTDAASWPEANGTGSGFRGGSWYTGAAEGVMANRQYAAGIPEVSSRSHDTGFRCVRTACSR